MNSVWNFTSRFSGALLLVATMVAPAAATSSRVPRAHVDRTLALPDGTWRIDAGPRWPHYDGQFKEIFVPGPNLRFLNPGFSFGLTGDTDFGFVTPVQLEPGAEFEDPRIHVLHQFERGRVDVGIFGGLRLGVFDQWVLVGGVPVLFHWKNNLRLDTGGFLVMGFGDGSSVSLQAPAEFVFQLGAGLFLGPETGLHLNNLFEGGFDVAIPAGFVLGYAIAPSGGTLGDVYGRLRIEDIEQGSDVVSLMFGLEFYFD